MVIIVINHEIRFGNSPLGKPLNEAWSVIRNRDFSKTGRMAETSNSFADEVICSEVEGRLARMRADSRKQMDIRAQRVIMPDSELGSDLQEMFQMTTSIVLCRDGVTEGGVCLSPVLAMRFLPSSIACNKHVLKCGKRLKLQSEPARNSEQSSGMSAGVAPEYMMFAILHHCCLAQEAGVLHQKSLMKLAQAVDRSREDPGVLRPYHWLLQTQLGKRRTVCHHLLNSICKLGGAATSSSACGALVWLCRGVLSAEHSLLLGGGYSFNHHLKRSWLVATSAYRHSLSNGITWGGYPPENQ